MQKLLSFAVLLILCGCASPENNKVIPSIVPNIAKEKQIVMVRPSNVIGEVEPIYIIPMKTPFESRIDTGATTSSLDVSDLKYFERDGEQWASFKVINRSSGETATFEKPIVKKVKVKRINDDEHRKTVEMDVKFGGEKFKAAFTLAERSDFDYQTLIGRNILSGRYVVDVSTSHTLR